MMKQALPALFGLALLMPYGVAEGLWTNRWHVSAGLERATARLAQLPHRVGDWEGRDQELDPRQVARAEMSGYLMRRYTHGPTGAEVSILLVCGRPGPTALHSPDVCYAGAGYAAAQPPARHEIAAGAGDTLWVGDFRKPGPAPEPLRIYWAWNGAGAWQAPDSPRVQFAHYPALYKLYVIRDLAHDEPIAEDVSQQFLREFLPVAQRVLFPEQ
jgi:hypothetical protein